MQARSLDPVAHPRAIQPLDQNTEVRLKDNYYVVSHRDKSVKMCDNLLLFLFIWDISGHVSKSYYFQRVRATRNIMHVMLWMATHGCQPFEGVKDPSLFSPSLDSSGIKVILS